MRRGSSLALLASAKEFTGARYCSWMGRRGRKREAGKVGGGAEDRIGKASWEKLDLLPLKL